MLHIRGLHQRQGGARLQSLSAKVLGLPAVVHEDCPEQELKRGKANIEPHNLILPNLVFIILVLMCKILLPVSKISV